MSLVSLTPRFRKIKCCLSKMRLTIQNVLKGFCFFSSIMLLNILQLNVLTLSNFFLQHIWFIPKFKFTCLKCRLSFYLCFENLADKRNKCFWYYVLSSPAKKIEILRNNFLKKWNRMPSEPFGENSLCVCSECETVKQGKRNSHPCHACDISVCSVWNDVLRRFWGFLFIYLRNHQ